MYAGSEVFGSLEEFISSGDGLPRSARNDGNIQTFVIGQAPDVEQYRNFVSLDTRSREIRNRSLDVQGMPKVDDGDGIANLVIRRYRSSMGWEYFLSFEDGLGYLYGLLRLLLPDTDKTVDFAGLGKETAMVRELHIYGQMAGLKTQKIQ